MRPSSSRGSRPAVKRVRFAPTATAYGVDAAPSTVLVRGPPHIRVRPKRTGSSALSAALSSSKSPRSTSIVTRSRGTTSSRPAQLTQSTVATAPAACPRPRAPSVASSTSSTSSQPFRSVSFARAAARSPSPAPAPASCSAPALTPSPVESSAGVAVDARASSVVSRSVTRPAASVRSHPVARSTQSAVSDQPARQRRGVLTKPSIGRASPVPDSRPLLKDSITRRMDEVQRGIRQLREETRALRDGHRRMTTRAAPARPAAAAVAAPVEPTRRTTNEAIAKAIDRPRHPSPPTARAITRARAPIEAPSASETIRVPRTRPHAIKAPSASETVRVPRTRPHATKAPSASDKIRVPRARPHAPATAQAEPRRRTPTPTTTVPAPAAAPAKVSPETSAEDVYQYLRPSARKVINAADDLLARIRAERNKPKSILKRFRSKSPSKHVSFNENVGTAIVDRWITKEDVHPAPPKIAGSLQGWKTEPLPEPTDDGEWLHFTTYWATAQCSQLTHSHYLPCAQGCAWNRLAKIQRSKALSTAASFRVWNAERQVLREERGVDLL